MQNLKGKNIYLYMYYIGELAPKMAIEIKVSILYLWISKQNFSHVRCLKRICYLIIERLIVRLISLHL